MNYPVLDLKATGERINQLRKDNNLIITHKQEILKEADQIIMLKDGAVVGSGVYDDLSKDNLEFKNMLKMGENIE